MSEGFKKVSRAGRKRNVVLASVVLSSSAGGYGATSATVSVFASDDVKPDDVSVAKTSTTGYESCVTLGTPTAFASDSSQTGYQWKATFTVTSNLVGWPTGSVNPVVVLAVSNADGVSVGTVSVTLDALAVYLVTPTVITLTPD
jgi:hypothetical protein